jgi:hypothetical protein
VTDYAPRMSDDARATVRFTGGPHHGLVVTAPPDLAARLPDMQFEITAAGGLFDTVAQMRIRGVKVLVRPGETPPPPPAPKRTPVPAAPVLDLTPAPTVRRAPIQMAPVFLAPGAR